MSSQCHLTSIDLFCGAGGLSLGLRNAGFVTTVASDTWTPALETMAENMAGVRILDADVRELDAADLVERSASDAVPTAVVGGPPCQGFTSAGARRTGDVRNTLIAEFARLVAEIRPRIVLFENVEGFLTLDHGRFVIDLLDPLLESGYHVRVQKVNVANFGVPQLRKRVIALGMLGQDPGFPTPTHHAYGAPGAVRSDTLHLQLAPTVMDWIGHLPDPHPGPPGVPPDHYVRRINDDEHERIRHLRPGNTMRDLPGHLQHSSYVRRANRRVSDGKPLDRRGGAPAGIRRLRADEPSKAITSAAIREFIHPVHDRPLTLRECAAIQTFPDSFKFCGATSDKATLIGNAIPPLFATVLGRHLAELVEGHDAAPTVEQGRLLSFEPTPGSGMSPALQQVTETIARRYEMGELPLWS